MTCLFNGEQAKSEAATEEDQSATGYNGRIKGGRETRSFEAHLQPEALSSQVFTSWRTSLLKTQLHSFAFGSKLCNCN
jgi:hypothetical protein